MEESQDAINIPWSRLKVLEYAKHDAIRPARRSCVGVRRRAPWREKVFDVYRSK